MKYSYIYMNNVLIESNLDQFSLLVRVAQSWINAGGELLFCFVLLACFATSLLLGCSRCPSLLASDFFVRANQSVATSLLLMDL